MTALNKNTIFVILILSLALGIGLWRNKHAIGRPQHAGTLGQIKQVKTLTPFHLTEVVSGKAFTDADLKQKWSFVFFGYSTCPDICPKTIGTLNQIASALPNQPWVQYLFISIHPEKDTPQTLSAFLMQAKFQPSIIKGLTGDKAQILDLARQIGIFIDEHPSQPELSGPIEHSGTIVLLNPKGELAAIFSNSDSPAHIAQDFRKRLKPTMASY